MPSELSPRCAYDLDVKMFYVVCWCVDVGEMGPIRLLLSHEARVFVVVVVHVFRTRRLGCCHVPVVYNFSMYVSVSILAL